jgi:CheY-like chemotaxis protein
MPAQRVLVVDENQSFCTQVVAAFSEVGIEARGGARGSEALLLAASFLPDLIIVDLVRPGSEGRWLLGRLYAQGDETPLSTAPRLVLALAPVAGDFSGLPDGVEVMVKPIFPGQVVASATRLLGSLGGHALPLSGAASRTPVGGTPPVFAVPPPSGLSPSAATSAATPFPAVDARPAYTGKPTVEHVLPPGPPPPRLPIDPFDDDSDFGPADTLLAPAASISELARSMVHVPDPHAEPATVASEDAATTLLRNNGEETVPLVEFNLRGELAHRVELGLGLPPSGSPATVRRAEPPSSGWPLGSVESDREALTGSLAAIPLLDLLSLLARQCQTGILRVSYAPALTSASGSLARSFMLILRRGQLEQVVAVGLPNLRLGRFILELETLRQPELDAVAAARGKRSRTASEDTDSGTGVPMATDFLLGGRLCAAGLLSADELRQALRRQSTELLYEALRLSRGRFTFERTRELPDWASEPAHGAALGLDVEALLLEGTRRADDWYQLDLDTAENAVYVSTVAADQDLRKLGLSSAECAVLLLCSGRHSVAEIAKESRLSLLDVSRTLGRLVSLRLCRRRLPAVLAS